MFLLGNNHSASTIICLKNMTYCIKCMALGTCYSVIFCMIFTALYKAKAVLLQAWSGPESSRKLRFPDFMTTAQGGGKVVSVTHQPHLPAGNSPGTHFCWDCGGTVVKVLRYKSEGRWFDSRWCHWNFSLT